MIHLDECEPEGKGWTRMTYKEATEWGAVYPEFCPAVEYMREELGLKEQVWVENNTSSLEERRRELEDQSVKDHLRLAELEHKAELLFAHEDFDPELRSRLSDLLGQLREALANTDKSLDWIRETLGRETE